MMAQLDLADANTYRFKCTFNHKLNPSVVCNAEGGAEYIVTTNCVATAADSIKICDAALKWNEKRIKNNNGDCFMCYKSAQTHWVVEEL